MQSFSLRARCIFACVGAGLAIGCSGFIKQSAADAIVFQLQPRNSVVAKELETRGNPKGEGVVVLVPAESGCAPQYSWLWINKVHGAYALDDASHTLTPGLRKLSEASPKTLQRIGGDARTLSGAIRDSICQPTRR